MNFANYYTTIGAVFDYLVEINKKTGQALSFPAAIESMYHSGLLQSSPLPLPSFYPNMSREEFSAFIRAMPISADLILKQMDPFNSSGIVYETNFFPGKKDVFCYLQMPYMDRHLHFHDFFEITYVIKGSCTLLFEGETASLGTGDVCITSPMSAHSLSLKPNCMAMAISVRRSTFDSLFGNLLSKQDLVSLFFRNSLYERQRTNYILLCTGADDNLFRTAQALAYESNLTDDYSNFCSVSLLDLFLALSLRAAQAAVTLYRYENYSGRDFDFTLVLQYIQQNYRTVTLSSLADAFHFSKNYMSKLIHEKMGCGYTELLRSVKMRHALDYLMNTSMKISEISDAGGYDSVDHFSRTFRRVYGVSPQQYKQTHDFDS